MTPRLIVLLTAASLALAACGDHAAHDHDHGDDHPASEAGHDHAHEPGADKHTHFSDRTELFVEFPRLVVGEPSAFAAHLTTLDDFRALAAGTVTVRLSGGGQPEERFVAQAASTPGIFRPVATPRHAGTRTLSIEVVTPAFKAVHALGPVTVYANRQAADAAPAPAEDSGIVLTKEQQWQSDFATAPAVSRPMRQAIAATGQVRARPDGEALVSAVAAGHIHPAGAFPRLGQAVKAGQVLAYLVPRLGGDTDLASLRAAADKARVAHALAQQERRRLEALLAEEAVAEKRVIDARAAEALARAELTAAQQRVGQVSGAGGGIVLRAPVSGVLADVRATPGAFAADGAPLFHIVDRRRLWLELRVPESEAAGLAEPVGAAFRVAGRDDTVEIVAGRTGRLVAVGGLVDATTRTVPVVFEFTPDSRALPVGLAVQAQVFTGGTREAVAVPAASVIDDNGTAVVYVMRGGESFERRPVRLGARDGDWIEVVEGLAPGSRVVSRGAYLVRLAASGPAQIGHGHAH